MKRVPSKASANKHVAAGGREQQASNRRPGRPRAAGYRVFQMPLQYRRDKKAVYKAMLE
jgi:hypothetical protein